MENINLLLSAFGRFGTHFLKNLMKKLKIPFYQPSADLGLIFQQNLIKIFESFLRPLADFVLIFNQNLIINIIFYFIGLRSILGSFFNKIE
jgi:hypothetical protein